MAVDDKDESTAQRIAVVFGGGAGLGALQVGQLRALAEHGIRPDLVTGTSSGAVNALLYASDPTLEGIARIEKLWMSVGRKDLFRIRPHRVVTGLLGSSTALASGTRLRRLLEAAASVERLEHTQIPLGITATNSLTRTPTLMQTGSAIEIVLASAAVPGLFPPVEIDGIPYIDGGLSSDPPLGAAVQMGATTAYVLPVGWPMREPVRGNAAMRIADAVDWLCWRLAEVELARWSSACDVHLLPSPSTRSVAPFDLRHTRGLIESAYSLSMEWFANECPAPGAAVASEAQVPIADVSLPRSLRRSDWRRHWPRKAVN